ncbi:hypothetical protein HK100_001991, partial [Physocladia obscura]
MIATVGDSLGITIVVDFGIQFVFYMVSAVLQTERFYDISGSLTFLSCILVALLRRDGEGNSISALSARQIAAAVCVMLWALRLGSFLLLRVSKHPDRRFDELKKKPLSFAVTWILQVIWIFLTAFPAYIVLANDASSQPAFGWSDYIGIIIWIFGILVEGFADSQKMAFKTAYPEKFFSVNQMQSGLFKYSRYPNYFGEVRLLEISSEAKYGTDPEFIAYKARTSKFILCMSKILVLCKSILSVVRTMTNHSVGFSLLKGVKALIKQNKERSERNGSGNKKAKHEKKSAKLWVNIAVWFGDCVYSRVEITSVALGLASLVLFAIAMFPQIVSRLNYTRKSVEGLSWNLMLFWVFGDIGNLLGSIFTNQLALQIKIAIYFILVDLITLGQIFWYGFFREWMGFVSHPVYDEVVVEVDDGYDSGSGEEQGRAVTIHTQRTFLINEETPLLGSDAGQFAASRNNGFGSPAKNSFAKYFVSALLTCLFLFVVIGSGNFTFDDVADIYSGSNDGKLCNERDPISKNEYILGCFCSWVSGLLYFFSRTSQIRENHDRKSVEGVSIALFILTLAANLCYGGQIMLRGIVLDSHFYLAVLPFIIGSIGTI